MSRGRAALLVAVVACLAGCSVQTTVGVRFVPASELENRLPALLPDDLRASEPVVDCPEPLDATVGATATCRVYVAGRKYDAVVETVDGESDPVEVRLAALRRR